MPGHDAEDEFAAHDLEVRPSSRSRHLPTHRADAAKPPYRIALVRTDSAEAKSALAHGNVTFDPVMESEGLLHIEPRGVTIIGATGAGIFYGVQTFKQLLPLPDSARALPTGTVRDWPAMRYRGIDDDLPAARFPPLAFQKHRRFASSPHPRSISICPTLSTRSSIPISRSPPRQAARLHRSR